MLKNTTITSPIGFKAAGITCGIKKSGKKDLGIIVSDEPATAAAMFTTNKIVSAAVTTCKRHINSTNIRAIVVNSGNANACTGKTGLQNSQKMCENLAKLLKIDKNSVLLASTGIIGEQLPMPKINKGIRTAFDNLSASQKAGRDFAAAIMTTDTKIKQTAKKIKIDNKNITIAGTAKGAGMIGPNMATTLSFFTTDAAISKPLLQKAFRQAIGSSLNKLTVDGHQSTNDTAIIIASAKAQNKKITKTGPQYHKFAAALAEITQNLAEQMALDAEGATKMFKVIVNGALTKKQAEKAARAVADYDLVKCAIHGGDPNWGRIICAVGSCGVKLNDAKLTCKIGPVTVFRNGRPVKFDRKKAENIINSKNHDISINLGVGKFSDFCLGCDLTKDYVKINADYHT